MSMNKILITGGAGFIGSHLCRRLLEQGKKVICLDNMFTGSYNNISICFNNKNFEFINRDVALPLELDVDAIFNLACPASPIHYQYDPVMTTQTSFMGAMNVLEMARKNGAKVLQASTSEVYGDPLEHPQCENYWGNVNPIGPRACYDEGKRVAETLFADYRRRYGTDTKIVRIFNTYGPNMAEKDGRVVSNFIVQALRNQDITVYGSGSQTRSFCYVDDLVSGLIAMMERDNLFGPVNLGNPCEISIAELAKQIIEMTGSASKIVYRELPDDDPVRRKPDISLAKTELSWSPTVGIEDGLKRTIDYFKNSSFL